MRLPSTEKKFITKYAVDASNIIPAKTKRMSAGTDDSNDLMNTVKTPMSIPPMLIKSTTASASETIAIYTDGMSVGIVAGDRPSSSSFGRRNSEVKQNTTATPTVALINDTVSDASK